jgi:hypothetical protein
MSDVGLPLVDPPGRGHVHGAASCCHAAILQRRVRVSRGPPRFLVATFSSPNRG